MILEYIRYRIPQDKSAAFEASYRDAGEHLNASEQCLGYNFARCVEDPELYIVQIQWTSLDDHMQKFRQSEEFQQFLPLVRAFFDNIEEMQHYNIVE